MIQVGDTVILNGDLDVDIKRLNLLKTRLLTCGLSLRSTVTASSISDEGFTFCLQRGIITLKNELLSPQEFNVYWREKPDEIYPYLEIVTLLLICGVSVEVFSSLRF